jgi:hypothetical protein
MNAKLLLQSHASSTDRISVTKKSGENVNISKVCTTYAGEVYGDVSYGSEK